MENAVVGILGVVFGILLSNAATVVLDLRRRRERIKDVQTSLRAEMRSHWHRLDPQDLRDRAGVIVMRMQEAAEKGEAFTPLIPREDQASIFDAMVRELHILPNDVIDPVVLYYTHLKSISHFVDDLRSDRFATLEASRKVEMYQDYILMKEQAHGLATEAIRAVYVALASGRTQ